MKKRIGCLNACLAVALASFGAISAMAQGAGLNYATETIVLIRHGEKPRVEIGQLSVKGLNRSLALPDVLIGKFGKPDYIFAPNPSDDVRGKNDPNPYSYIRPLATIEPTAIKLDMPVNTQIGYADIKGLQTELTKPMYAAKTIFVAWEHLMEDQFARNVVTTYGGDPSTVPPWPGGDYDSIFVIRLQQLGGKTTATFSVDHEGLNDKIGTAFPAAAGP